MDARAVLDDRLGGSGQGMEPILLQPALGLRRYVGWES